MSRDGNGLTTGVRPFPPDAADCELCAAARYTHWYGVGEHGWVADCEVCQVPMAVWWHHGPEAPESAVDELLTMLSEAADHRFGAGNWTVDRTMRQVPDHFHAHARDVDWWTKPWTRPMSLYTGVGGVRRTR
jgi:hypothetical protein